MEDLQPVTVNILGRNYKLRISRSEEETLRAAAEELNAQAKIYGKHFSYQDHQDLLAMVALSKITELIKVQRNVKYKDTELISTLTEIDNVLEKYLHPTQNSL